MRACATQVKSLERCAVLRETNQRSKSKKLIESLFAVVNVSAAQTVLLFEIMRRDYLAGHDHLAELRRVGFQLVDDVARKLITTPRPITLLQLVRRELSVNRHHVFARRRQRRIAERRNADIEIRIA